MKPLNVVFIMTDTQRFDMLRCNGTPWIHTPCLDRLAASGCNFASAYTTSPLCTPARAALFTGLYPSSSGADANEKNVYRDVHFLGELTSAAGIASGYIGKWHLAGKYPYYGSGIPDGGFMPEYWYDGERFKQDVGEENFERWKKGSNLAASDCWGARVADRAIDFLTRHHQRQFFLCISFDEPHGPSVAPEKFYELYRGTQRPWMPNMGDRLADKPAAHVAKRVATGNGGFVADGVNPNNTPRFYGCNTFIDEQIGRVVATIDELCGENTAIIYTSDHGDHAGAHTLLSKGSTMYEETVHVPLIIRAPGLTTRNSQSSALISHIDIAPTMLGLLGLEIPNAFQGRDARSLVAEPQREWRDAVFMEYGSFGIVHENWWGFMPIRCIRTRDYKLVLNLVDRDELYDLNADPGEITNRIEDPALTAIRNGLHDRLLRWMRERQDPLRGEGWYARPWRPNFHLDPTGKQISVETLG